MIDSPLCNASTMLCYKSCSARPPLFGQERPVTTPDLASNYLPFTNAHYALKAAICDALDIFVRVSPLNVGSSKMPMSHFDPLLPVEPSKCWQQSRHRQPLLGDPSVRSSWRVCAAVSGPFDADTCINASGWQSGRFNRIAQRKCALPRLNKSFALPPDLPRDLILLH